MSAIKRLKPVETIHPAIKAFYNEKRRMKIAHEKALKEHARKTATIQYAVLIGEISELEAIKAYK